jgi:hypothetical protein
MTDTVRFAVPRGALAERITLDEWLGFAENEYRETADVLARFMVDEHGAPIEHAQARKVLGKLTLARIQELKNEFIAAACESAVPKASAP